MGKTNRQLQEANWKLGGIQTTLNSHRDVTGSWTVSSPLARSRPRLSRSSATSRKTGFKAMIEGINLLDKRLDVSEALLEKHGVILERIARSLEGKRRSDGDLLDFEPSRQA